MGNQWIKAYRDGRWTSIKCPTGETKIFSMTIGPVLAQKWLEQNNTCNRRLKPNQIKKITHDIQRGNWFDTADYIAFYRDGQLHDGQNRLSAIVQAGRQIKTRVVFGIEPEAVKVSGTSKPRTLGDRVKLSGMNCDGRSLRAAKYILETMKGNYNVFDDEIVSFHNKYKDVLDKVCKVVNSRFFNKQPVQSAISLVAIQQKDRIDDIIEFAERYNSGIGIKNEKSPAMKLRNLAMDQRKSNSGPWRKELFLKTLFACRAFLEGKTEIQRLDKAKDDTIFVDGFVLEF